MTLFVAEFHAEIKIMLQINSGKNSKTSFSRKNVVKSKTMT